MSGVKGMPRLRSNDESTFKAGTSKRKTYVTRLYAAIDALADGVSHTDEDIHRVATTISQFKLANNSKAVSTFIRYATATPWIKVERSAIGTRFTIDRELRAICEGRAPREELGGLHLKSFLENLAREIDRRRKENYEKRKRLTWDPDSVSKLEQSNLLDWIEYELKKLLTVAASGSQPDNAPGHLIEIGEQHVSENGSKNRTVDA